MRRNGEHVQDTTIRPEMKAATQGHHMVYIELQKDSMFNIS